MLWYSSKLSDLYTCIHNCIMLKRYKIGDCVHIFICKCIDGTSGSRGRIRGASLSKGRGLMIFYSQNATFSYFFLCSRLILSIILIEIWQNTLKTDFYFNHQHFSDCLPQLTVHAQQGQILDPPLDGMYCIACWFLCFSILE